MRRFNSKLYIIAGCLYLGCQAGPKSKDRASRQESAPSERCETYEESLANLAGGDGTRKYVWTEIINYKEMFGSYDQSSTKHLLKCLKIYANESAP